MLTDAVKRSELDAQLTAHDYRQKTQGTRFTPTYGASAAARCVLFFKVWGFPWISSFWRPRFLCEGLGREGLGNGARRFCKVFQG